MDLRVEFVICQSVGCNVNTDRSSSQIGQLLETAVEASYSLGEVKSQQGGLERRIRRGPIETMNPSDPTLARTNSPRAGMQAPSENASIAGLSDIMDG